MTVERHVAAPDRSSWMLHSFVALPFGTPRSRLRAGWSIADAMKTPVDPSDRRAIYWSPETALAIFEFINEMRDIIFSMYGTHIQDAARQRNQSALTERVIIPDDELPF